jgi:hypothetical protein
MSTNPSQIGAMPGVVPDPSSGQPALPVVLYDTDRNQVTAGDRGAQLPVWTYEGTIVTDTAGGKFYTDAANPENVSAIVFSFLAKSAASVNLSGFPAALPPGAVLLMTDATGNTLVFAADSFAVNGSANGAVHRVASASVDAVNFSGDYTVQFAPAVTPDLRAVLGASSILTIWDGTYTVARPNSNGSITFSRGICSAYSPGS